VTDQPSAGPTVAVILAWTGDSRELVPVASEQPAPGVADSWLVDYGRVRGLRLHRERFTGACLDHYGVPVSLAGEFFAAACAAVPDHGRWFPRVEFHRDRGFLLRLRMAPDGPASVVMTTATGPDPRKQPAIKGPDLGMLSRLRAAAASQGASEVLLMSRGGAVLEGALSSVLWWRGNALCLPPPNLPLLPGVTRRLILDIAASRQVRVRFEVCPPEALDGTEIWTASALSGIRAVTGWTGHDISPGPAERAASWQRDLLAMAVPVTQELDDNQPR
jgi:branched-subunit amino acid aminotransferase/4-amino-4-deoxychorismate lyase